MKTLTIDIQDSFLKEFLNFVQKSQNKILDKRRYKRWQRKALFNR